MIKYFSCLSILLCLPLLAGCSLNKLEDQLALPHTRSLVITHPQSGVVVPRNLNEIEVTWTDTLGNASWDVHILGEKFQMMETAEPRLVVKPGDYVNAGFQESSDIVITVCVRDRKGKPSGCGEEVFFRVSEHQLSDTIMYRLVEPLFNAGQDSTIMRKETVKAEPEPVFETRGICIGCHAYASNGLAAFNIRKGKDRRLVIIKPGSKGVELFDSKKIGEFAFISWSPDARTLAIVANTFGTIDVKQDVIEPFNLMYQSGDIALYDVATKQINLLPGASEMDFTEDMPAWSPDGKELLYVKYHADKEQGIKNMGIYRVPFNNGQGGVSEAVVVPSKDGEYYYFPNYSPDGKWISFVKGNGSRGVFARRTSDIYLMPGSGGEPKRLLFNIDGVMDSWHRWSSDSRWLLFSSKRGGDMTALYLSSIDENGKAAPPVRLAQHAGMKVNLPEFVKLSQEQRDDAHVFSALIDSLFKER